VRPDETILCPDRLVSSFLGTCSDGPNLCLNGLGRKLFLQRVFKQPTNVFGQASIEIG